MATDTTNLSRKGLLRVLVAQNDALLAGQRDLSSQLTSSLETLLMGLNKNEQDVVNRIDQSTTKIADVITKGVDSINVGTQAIRDLFNNQSSITLADVAPKLDAMDTAADAFGSAADALKLIATTDDPALTPTAPPIIVTDPTGTEVPVSEPPTP
jgi:hypothetical protein